MKNTLISIVFALVAILTMSCGKNNQQSVFSSTSWKVDKESGEIRSSLPTPESYTVSLSDTHSGAVINIRSTQPLDKEGYTPKELVKVVDFFRKTPGFDFPVWGDRNVTLIFKSSYQAKVSFTSAQLNINSIGKFPE